MDVGTVGNSDLCRVLLLALPIFYKVGNRVSVTNLILFTPVLKSL